MGKGTQEGPVVWLKYPGNMGGTLCKQHVAAAGCGLWGHLALYTVGFPTIPYVSSKMPGEPMPHVQPYTRPLLPVGNH